MSDETGYNGWKNYETWAVALWMDNDQGSYEWARQITRAAIEEWVEDGGRTPEGVVADELKEWMEDANPLEDGPASVFTDLLRSALGEVDYYEIAASLCSEVRAELVV